MTWRPLLDDQLAAEAWHAIDDLAAREPAGVATFPGWAELALVHAYRDRARPSQEAHDEALACVDRALDVVGSQPDLVPALYAGFAGTAWVLEHLQAQLGDPEDDLNADTDAALLDELRPPWTGGYDLLTGLVGIGVYALERVPRPSGIACLEQVIARLDDTAERRGDRITWAMPAVQRDLVPLGSYNTGVAHGVPGVIAMLARACAAGVAPDRARGLLDGAMRWLLAQRRPEATSNFPTWVVPGTPPDHETRAAWCYGDPGVAATMLVAARLARQPAWEEAALAIARHAGRRPPASCGVGDAALCHGAAGLAHLYNRMFQATGDAELRGAALGWIRKALETWRALDDASLLTGTAGVALALVAAASPIAPDWDRVLLCSG